MWSLLSKMFHKKLRMEVLTFTPSFSVPLLKPPAWPLHTAEVQLDSVHVYLFFNSYRRNVWLYLTFVPSNNLAGVNKCALSSEASSPSGVRRN